MDIRTNNLQPLTEDKEMTEPVPTRVWNGLQEWGYINGDTGMPGRKGDLERAGCTNIQFKEPPENQLCTTREDVEQFIIPKNLKNTSNEFYQEFRV
eukprot:SAG11_NODE_16420_length_547_cov_17.220982_1_plen_95_part_01